MIGMFGKAKILSPLLIFTNLEISEIYSFVSFDTNKGPRIGLSIFSLAVLVLGSDTPHHAYGLSNLEYVNDVARSEHIIMAIHTPNIGKHFLSHSHDINQPTVKKALISDRPADVPLPNINPTVQNIKILLDVETLSHDGRSRSNTIKVNPIKTHAIVIGIK
jgi:hypothetical protein